MDFVKHILRQRNEDFYLRFSKLSTVVWAGMLILVAYLSRTVEFVLNAAFSLRGLTSGALLGGLALAVFWRHPDWAIWQQAALALSWLLIVPPITAFLTLNFTGSTTFTSRSGVRREIFAYVPVMAWLFGGGVVLSLALRFAG